MHFHKDAVASGRDGSTRQHRRQFGIAGCGVPCSAGPLHRVRRVEDYAITRLAHPMERAHIGDEIVVTEGRAALRETEFFVAESDELFRNVLHIPRREELTFLYVD